MVLRLGGFITLAAFAFSGFVCEPLARAQAPSTTTIALSLTTINKALAGCREAYTQVWPGGKVPMVKEVLGAEAYEKDMSSLDYAEALTKALIASPEKISGKALVFVLSLADDFAVGAASTQTSLLITLIKLHLDGGSDSAKEILLSASALGACQRSLFNASDDYVSLVQAYVGAAEDRAVSDNLFVWDRPKLIPRNLPLTQSATCRFRKGLAVAFQKVITPQEPNPPERVYYSASNEDEANTVAFVDLDSKTPKVQSNGGQATLIVVNEDGQSVTLLNHRAGANASELYTIFRKTGIVIYSQQQEAPIIGPFGVLEMGYCN